MVAFYRISIEKAMAIRAGAKKVSFDASAKESQLLDEYCELINLSRTEVCGNLCDRLSQKSSS
jgi:hypothetical protein